MIRIGRNTTERSSARVEDQCPGQHPGIPLSFAKIGEDCVIMRISGNEDTRRHLSELGFVIGTKVSAVCNAGDSLILDVRGSKVALDSHMSSRIFFRPGC